MTSVGIREGWYLMSVSDLEKELARRRGEATSPSNATSLSVDEAITYRDAGNLPDELGRTLRLVLEISDARDLGSLETKRLEYEPDFHDAPDWRREGSVPVNVVPLRPPNVRGPAATDWWEQPELARLEEEWTARGTVAGLHIPAEYRSFVYKTVLALQQAGRAVTVRSLLDSLARWMRSDDLSNLEAALHKLNPDA